MLVLVLSFVLCCLYASDTVIIAYNYKFYAQNPASAKLIFLAEVLKLCIASSLYWAEGRTAAAAASDAELSDAKQALCPAKPGPAEALPRFGKGDHSTKGAAASILRYWSTLPDPVKALLTFSVPAVCYFLTNK
jgi:hypothetical protein